MRARQVRAGDHIRRESGEVREVLEVVGVDRRGCQLVRTAHRGGPKPVRFYDLISLGGTWEKFDPPPQAPPPPPPVYTMPVASALATPIANELYAGNGRLLQELTQIRLVLGEIAINLGRIAVVQEDDAIANLPVQEIQASNGNGHAANQ